RAAGIAKEKHISHVVADSDSSNAGSVSLDGKQHTRTCLEMHVVGRRCSALGTIVDNEVAGQRRSEIQHVAKFTGDVLDHVIAMHDREMTIDDGKWIEVNRVASAECETAL